MSIAVVGFIFVDIKGYPSSSYIPGGRNAGKVRYVHGGVSRNIAEDLGNLGLNPVFLSLADPSGTGDDVLRRLQEHGVDTSLVRRVPNGMGAWLAVFDNCNDFCASISDRPDMAPLLTLLQEEGNACFRSVDSILMELDMDALRYLAEGSDPCAFAMVLASTGSTPAKPGALMTVDRFNAIHGTVGGGCGEAEVMTKARQLIGTGRSAVAEVDMTNEVAAENGMVCGGRMWVLLEDVTD